MMAYIALAMALQQLIDALEQSGRAQSAAFFLRHHALLSQDAPAQAAVEALHQLSTCSAMAQYADFSFAEERLLESVIDHARRLRSEESPP